MDFNTLSFKDVIQGVLLASVVITAVIGAAQALNSL